MPWEAGGANHLLEAYDRRQPERLAVRLANEQRLRVYTACAAMSIPVQMIASCLQTLRIASRARSGSVRCRSTLAQNTRSCIPTRSGVKS